MPLTPRVVEIEQNNSEILSKIVNITCSIIPRPTWFNHIEYYSEFVEYAY